MNANLLYAEMKEHGDTLETLSEYLQITKPTLCNKINGADAEFKQNEIMAIIERYKLNKTRAFSIFFAK